MINTFTAHQGGAITPTSGQQQTVVKNLSSLQLSDAFDEAKDILAGIHSTITNQISQLQSIKIYIEILSAAYQDYSKKVILLTEDSDGGSDDIEDIDEYESS